MKAGAVLASMFESLVRIPCAHSNFTGRENMAGLFATYLGHLEVSQAGDVEQSVH